ncbi:MAG: LysR family transcriptional regulator [Desulfovibrionaceae bacterium]|nr:LysR family transcriptional regulator [Desulfovibrionaceae bacterium]
MIEELNGDFLQWLRGFYWVAKTGSVRRAAEHMHRNPSTISYQLRSLEEELNTVLFDRYKKSLRITPEGAKLLDWAITTFEALQSMRSSVGSANGELKGAVSIAATLPIATLSVPTTVEFLRRYPGVDISLERGLSSDVRKSVAESHVDFGLLPVIEKPENDRLDVVFKARPLLVMRRDNSWNIPPVPDLEDLRRLPYVAFADEEDPDDLGCRCLNSGLGDFIQKNTALKVNNYHLIMRFVWHGLGVTIMDELCLQATNFGADWQQIGARPLDHLFPNRLYGILVRRNKHVSPQAQGIMKALREFFLSLPSLDAETVWRSARQAPDMAASDARNKKAGRKARPER